MLIFSIQMCIRSIILLRYRLYRIKRWSFVNYYGSVEKSFLIYDWRFLSCFIVHFKIYQDMHVRKRGHLLFPYGRSTTRWSMSTDLNWRLLPIKITYNLKLTGYFKYIFEFFFWGTTMSDFQVVTMK